VAVLSFLLVLLFGFLSSTKLLACHPNNVVKHALNVTVFAQFCGDGTILAEHLGKLLETLFRFIPVDILSASVVIHSSQDSLWYIFRIKDLNEWMFMVKSLFTYFTVVKVLTHAALVPDASDGCNTTSITSHIKMLDNFILSIKRALTLEGLA
jgi:hypothetical protein